MNFADTITLNAAINRIIQLVNNGAMNPHVRRIAMEIAEKYSSPRGMANAIFAWIKNNIRYVFDPKDTDQYSPVEMTLSLRKGDCEDMTILGVSIAKNLGLPARLKVLTYDEKKWSHIYPLFKIDGKWIPYDFTLPSPDMELGCAKAVVYET